MNQPATQDSIDQMHVVQDIKKMVTVDRLLSLADVEIIVDMKKTTIYRLVKIGKFPLQHPVITHKWILSEVLEWIKTGKVVDRDKAIT